MYTDPELETEYRAGWEAGFSYREGGCVGERPSAALRLIDKPRHRTAFAAGVAHGCAAAVDFYGKRANIRAPWESPK